MITSEKTDKLLPAILKAKKEMGALYKNSNNPHFKNDFADLNTHIEVVEPALESNGLLILQPPVANTLTGDNLVVTRIYHTESGQFVESSLVLKVEKMDMQKVGAAITYARRQQINGLLTMRSQDNDGNDAVGINEKATTKTSNYFPDLTSTNKGTGKATFAKPKAAVTKAVQKDDF